MQVAPSFFDAPGAQDSAAANAGMASASSLMPLPTPTPSLASMPCLSDDLPKITFAFASEVGYKVCRLAATPVPELAAISTATDCGTAAATPDATVRAIAVANSLAESGMLLLLFLCLYSQKSVTDVSVCCLLPLF